MIIKDTNKYLHSHFGYESTTIFMYGLVRHNFGSIDVWTLGYGQIELIFGDDDWLGDPGSLRRHARENGVVMG